MHTLYATTSLLDDGTVDAIFGIDAAGSLLIMHVLLFSGLRVLLFLGLHLQLLFNRKTPSFNSLFAPLNSITFPLKLLTPE